jgi:hypothetical protein
VAPARSGERWVDAYRRHVVPVYRLMHSRVGNAPDAEHLTSQVFLAALPLLQRAVSDAEVEKRLLAEARTALVGHQGLMRTAAGTAAARSLAERGRRTM